MINEYMLLGSFININQILIIPKKDTNKFMH